MPAKGAVAATCAALGLSCASLHRSATRQSVPLAPPVCRPSPPKALLSGPRKVVLDGSVRPTPLESSQSSGVAEWRTLSVSLTVRPGRLHVIPTGTNVLEILRRST